MREAADESVDLPGVDAIVGDCERTPIDAGGNFLYFSDAMPLPWEHIELILSRGCGRVRCAPGWRLHDAWNRTLSDFDLWLVWAGRGEMYVRGQRVDLQPGACFWMRPPGSYYATQDADDCLGVTFIHFDLIDRRTGCRAPDEDLPGEVFYLADFTMADAMMRRVVEQCSIERARDDADQQLLRTSAMHTLRGLLMDLDRRAGLPGQSDVAGTERRHRQIAMELASRIHENPAAALSVAELAKEAGYSADHFSRIFRSVTGQTPREFIVTARITRAQQLLRETDLSVGEIADVLGYEDVYFFSRQFKAKAGRTPTAFRKG